MVPTHEERMNDFFDWFHNRVKNIHSITPDSYARIECTLDPLQA